MKRIRKTGEILASQEGFSLVEVVVAMVILAVGLLAIATMQISAIQGNDFADQLTQATTHAQDKAEELMVLTYTDDDLDVGDHGPEEVGNYDIEWSVESGTTVPGTKIIDITASWQEDGTTKSTTLVMVKPQL